MCSAPVTIDSPGGQVAAIGLAPMAVLPRHQRKGIGSRLVREGLDQLRRLEHEAVVVVGHAGYYPRFGFVPASRFGLRWENDWPDENFFRSPCVRAALPGEPASSGTARSSPGEAEAPVRASFSLNGALCQVDPDEGSTLRQSACAAPSASGARGRGLPPLTRRV